MERQILNKKKRVFSLEPNNNPSTIFMKKYKSHLAPRLKKLSMNKPSSSQINQQNVKREVDMALALSAQEFAWSRFLLQKLSSSENPTTTTTTSSFSPNEEEGDEIEERLKELQKLLPGGEEMNVEDMLSEIGTYIKYLELQTIALKSILKETS